MPRAQKKPLHPLRMVEALEAMNEAAGMFSMKVHTVAKLLAEPGLNAGAIARLGATLDAAQEVFRAALWPDEET
jgi:hypothetical protein